MFYYRGNNENYKISPEIYTQRKEKSTETAIARFILILLLEVQENSQKSFFLVSSYCI